MKIVDEGPHLQFLPLPQGVRGGQRCGTYGSTAPTILVLVVVLQVQGNACCTLLALHHMLGECTDKDGQHIVVI